VGRSRLNERTCGTPEYRSLGAVTKPLFRSASRNGAKGVAKRKLKKPSIQQKQQTASAARDQKGRPCFCWIVYCTQVVDDERYRTFNPELTCFRSRASSIDRLLAPSHQGSSNLAAPLHGIRHAKRKIRIASLFLVISILLVAPGWEQRTNHSLILSSPHNRVSRVPLD